jgi:predicted DNA-binding transcriptional regulator YafY
VTQAEFRPLLAKPDATRFLGELRLVEVGLLSVEDTMLGVVPPFDATPVPERRIDPFVLRAVVFAMRGRESLDVVYQSMSRPEAGRRVIEPHALAYDGFRWHTRAFDRESGEFRDFVLGRLSKPKARAKANSRPEDDIEWQTFVDLVIAPHPDLTSAQSKAIAIDYGIHGNSTSIRKSGSGEDQPAMVELLAIEI